LTQSIKTNPKGNLIRIRLAKLSSRAKEIIEGQNIAFVATVMPDGSPHVSPVWIDHDSDMILVNTAEGRVKAKNVRRDPRVSISVVDSKNPYPPLIIRGKVKEVTENGAVEHIRKMSKKYTGSEKFELGPGEKRIIVKIELTHEIMPK
jgi:PPOX class probable F420-dependent enzyme